MRRLGIALFLFFEEVRVQGEQRAAAVEIELSKPNPAAT